MQNQEAEAYPPDDHLVPDGDMTTIARLSMPTEAGILKDCLRAAGIPACIADGNLVQADSLLSIAVGGVRVMVPTSRLDEAKEVLHDFERGAFELESDDERPVVKPKVTNIPLWNPDAAAFFAIFLTPVFASIIHFLNSRALQNQKLMRTATISLVTSVVITAIALYMAAFRGWSWVTMFHASLIASAYTLLWYFFAGHYQSKFIAEYCGTRYLKRGLMKFVLLAVICMMLPGYIGEWLSDI